jgi:hypothetical protein
VRILLGVSSLSLGLAATGCDGRGTRHPDAPNVEIAAEPPKARDDRHARMIGNRDVIAYCDPSLRREVGVLFDMVEAMADQGAEVVAGMRVHAGWTTLSLVEKDGELVFQEPDYDATEPETAWRLDVSASLRMLVDQTEILTRIGLPGEQINFDQHVLVVHGTLEMEQVYLVRVASPGGRMTGWRVAPTEDQEGEMEIDSIPLYELYRKRPALVRAMLLPVGYMAFFTGDDIDVIVDPDDQPVWERVERV